MFGKFLSGLLWLFRIPLSSLQKGYAVVLLPKYAVVIYCYFLKHQFLKHRGRNESGRAVPMAKSTSEARAINSSNACNRS